jgi:hypothetical protein
VGKRFVNSKKIGKIINKGKRENKKQYAPPELESHEDENQKENGHQGRLEWFHNRHVADIKKIKAGPIKESRRQKKRLHFNALELFARRQIS